jgi:hypothetical protein
MRRPVVDLPVVRYSPLEFWWNQPISEPDSRPVNLTDAALGNVDGWSTTHPPSRIGARGSKEAAKRQHLKEKALRLKTLWQ